MSVVGEGKMLRTPGKKSDSVKPRSARSATSVSTLEAKAVAAESTPDESSATPSTRRAPMRTTRLTPGSWSSAYETKKMPLAIPYVSSLRANRCDTRTNRIL